MQGGIFTYALLAALATGLLVAAFTDLRRRQIDNWLTAAIAGAAPLFWYSAGLSLVDIGWQVALAVAVFIVTAILFAMRQMGGGDLKLLVALALWIAPAHYAKLVIMMALVGGAASIAGAAFNMNRREGETARDAIGIIAATAWVVLSAGVIFSILSSRPMLTPTVMETVNAILPNLWLVVAVLLVVAATIIFGIFHIVSRQKSKLPIPYGVAISIAGLWVLAEEHFTQLQYAGGAG